MWRFLTPILDPLNLIPSHILINKNRIVKKIILSPDKQVTVLTLLFYSWLKKYSAYIIHSYTEKKRHTVFLLTCHSTTFLSTLILITTGNRLDFHQMNIQYSRELRYLGIRKGTDYWNDFPVVDKYSNERLRRFHFTRNNFAENVHGARSNRL